MSKILRNPGSSDVVLTDTGVTVPANNSYTIPPQNYPAFAASSDVIKALADQALILNDGGNDITVLSDAVDIIKGWAPQTPNTINPFFFDFNDIASGDSPIVLLEATGQAMNLLRCEVTCGFEALWQIQQNGQEIGTIQTGPANPSDRFAWNPSRPIVSTDIVQIILTKRAGSPDITVAAHLMAETIT